VGSIHADNYVIHVLLYSGTHPDCVLAIHYALFRRCLLRRFIRIGKLSGKTYRQYRQHFIWVESRAPILTLGR
jgi:hypothetical protein